MPRTPMRAHTSHFFSRRAPSRRRPTCIPTRERRTYSKHSMSASIVLWQIVSSTATHASPTKMKNIHYAGQGYNIVKGNPQCSGRCTASGGFDPGFFGTYSVIDLSYTAGKTTPDGRYLVPDSLDIEKAVSCSLVSHTSAVHSAYDYQHSLDVDASVDASIGGGFFLPKVHFSASVDFQTMAQKTGESASTVYSTRAACSVYQASTIPFTTLNLTAPFRNGVATLPATYDAARYYTFINYFGTHYVAEVQMGAKMVRNLECSSTASNTLTSHGVNVNAAVQVDYAIAHIKAGASVSWHQSDHDELSKMQCSASELIVGTAPPAGLSCGTPDCNPANLDMSPWQNYLLGDQGEPMPIQYKLASLDALLTSEYFPSDVDIAKKQLNLQQFLQNDYCGTVPGCAPPNPMGTWLAEPTPPAARIGAAAVAVGSSLFVIGGFDVVNGATATVDIFHNDDTSIEWAASPAAPPMNTVRHNLSAAVTGSFIYAIGGEAGGTPLVTVEQYNVQTQQWSARRGMMIARASFAAVTCADGLIFAIGGRGSSGKATAAVETYDANTDSWAARTPLNVAREGLCAGVIEGKLYAVGGFNGSFLGTLEAWNGSTWSLLPPMKYARSGAACAVIDGALIVYGGRNAQGVVDLVEAWDGKTWLERSRGLRPLWLGAGAALVDASEGTAKMFVVGGAAALPTIRTAGTVRSTFRTGAWVESSPALSPDGTTVYVGSYDSNLYAIDAASGKQKWSFGTGAGVESSPALSPDGTTVYVGSDDSNLYAIDAASGKQKWSFRTGAGVFSSPALSPDGTTVYVGSYDSNLYAIDAVSGKQKWSFRTGDEVESSPALSPDGTTVYVGSYDHNLYAIDAASGKQKWSFGTGGWVYSSPALSPDGTTVYVGSRDYNLYAIDAASGKQKWSFRTGDAVFSSPALSPDGTTVYVGSYDSNLYAIDAASGKQKWSFRTGAEVFSSPALSPDGTTVYVGSRDHNLYAIDAASGKQKWSFGTGDEVESSPALSPDGTTVYVGSDDSNLYAVWTSSSSWTAAVAMASLEPALV